MLLILRCPSLLAAALLVPFTLAGCQNMDLNGMLDVGSRMIGMGKENPELQAAAGLREAIGIGAERAATSLAKPGGYLQSSVRIPLPEPLRPVAKTLRGVGLGKYVDELENDMNVSAEIAAAQAAPIFRKAVAGMTVQDAVGIVQGGDTAATHYFRLQTEGELMAAFKPAIQEGMRKTGYYDSYRRLLDKYNALPLTSKPKLDLEQYVLDGALDGLFIRLGEEEKAIRRDPSKRTTDLLKKVFGAAG